MSFFLFLFSLPHHLAIAAAIATTTARKTHHDTPAALTWPPRLPFTSTLSRRARLVMTPRHSAITTRPRKRP
ncbi:hypothetical protein EDB89DRAFT_1972711 [Lactarius sanguifluus]|nr:hypothetical protein EDB89DRAFT_1972711 [Lactarius sanguifluus]